ncbi:hypothetical protein Spith_2276 [Spirochaeta thermophila DSM 6578]|uniref:Uncharacterized protein n=1 Tax=Winmispira thermophila (strain ATCC 700085 / DSM 6578 / Z-1203) TaxID=869211 RepID=G0GG55_WINT7|nr:hypothetical protein Spith_2276 [Spirochaeta thermophila DSM 6578]
MKSPSEKSVIQIPLKIALSPEGVNLFLQNRRPLQKIRFADTRETFGLVVNGINAQTLSQLLSKHYVDGIEASDSDILSRRDDILTLNRMLFRALLQERFNEDLKRVLLKSRMVAHWNRTNPQKAITENTVVSEAAQKQLLQSHGEVFQRIQGILLAPVYFAVEKEQGAETPEAALQKEVAREFFLHQAPFTWYLFAFIKDRDDKSLYTAVSDLILQYVRRSKIGDFLGATLIELIMNTENANIYSFATRKNIPGIKIDQIFFDQKLRNMVLTHMSKEEQKLYVMWLFKTVEARQGSAVRFQISVYNREYRAHLTQESLHDTKAALTEQSLEQYLASGGDIPFGSIDMTGFYIQSLKQECEAVSIHFDATITHLSRNDAAAVTLTLQI